MLLQLLLQGCFCCRAAAAARRHGLYTRETPGSVDAAPPGQTSHLLPVSLHRLTSTR